MKLPKYFIVLFSLLLLTQNLITPNTISADENNQNNDMNRKMYGDEIAQEAVESRGVNSKEFLLKDGRHRKVISNNLLHYYDNNGRLNDIKLELVNDSQLMKFSGEISKDSFKSYSLLKNSSKQNKKTIDSTKFRALQAPYGVEISNEHKGGFSFSSDNNQITLIPVDSNNTLGTVDPKSKGLISYSNSWNKVDSSVQLLPNGLMSSLTIKSPSSPKKLSFEFINDSNGNIVFTPYTLLDSKGNVGKVKQNFRLEGSKQYIDVEYDAKGLVYPLTLNTSLTLMYGSGTGGPSATTGFARFDELEPDRIEGLRLHLTAIRLGYGYFQENTTVYLTTHPLETGVGIPNNPSSYVKEIGTTTEFDGEINTAYWSGDEIRSKIDPDSRVFGAVYTSSRIHLFLVTANFVVDYIPNDTKPTKPQNLRATELTANSVRLSWKKSPDNDGNQSYKIYNGNQLITTTYDTTFVVRELSPNSTYSFNVTAYDDFESESEKATIKVSLGKSGKYTYEYDQKGRLINIRENGNVIRTFNYDANGNLLSNS